MKCTDFERHILLLANDQLVDAARREMSQAHVRLCGRCGHRLSEEQNLIAGIRAVRADLVTETAPPRVELKLLDAVRTQASKATVKDVKPHLTVWQWGAVAAGVLVLISTVAVFCLHSAFREKRADIISVETPAPAPATPQQQSLRVGLEPERTVVNIQKARRVRHAASHTTATERKAVTEFYPLLRGDDLSALEGIRVVTVELPSSALAEVGLPSPPAGEATSVRAEVLLGQDGVARAIRFVQ